jgi:hypothetical protein
MFRQHKNINLTYYYYLLHEKQMAVTDFYSTILNVGAHLKPVVQPMVPADYLNRALLNDIMPYL